MSEMNSARWLVTGGAGYIGAHVVRSLISNKRQVLVVDDLSTGKENRVPANADFLQIRLQESKIVTRAIEEFQPVGIIHLAARKQARESTRDPLGYWDSNVGAMLALMRAISDARANCPTVRSIVLSSSCSVYGALGAVSEESPLLPVSPYGNTKVACENILADVAPQVGLNWISLRYFNVIGNGEFPDAHDSSEECLVPAVSRACHEDKCPVIFGSSFPTLDGTCLRDYVDVRDLAEAHWLAAQHLENASTNTALTMNVGTNTPLSVLQIVSETQRSMNTNLPVEFKEAKDGDPVAIWSNSTSANVKLNWKPEFSIRDSISAHVRSAYGRSNE